MLKKILYLVAMVAFVSTIPGVYLVYMHGHRVPQCIMAALIHIFVGAVLFFCSKGSLLAIGPAVSLVGLALFYATRFFDMPIANNVVFGFVMVMMMTTLIGTLRGIWTAGEKTPKE